MKRFFQIVTLVSYVPLLTACTTILPSKEGRKIVIIGVGYVHLNDTDQGDDVIQANSTVLGLNIIQSEFNSASLGVSKTQVAVTPIDERGIILEHKHGRTEIYKPKKTNE